MRVTLDITSEAHRQLKTLAAFSGMTMKDFILNRALGAKTSAKKTRGKPDGMDETAYLLGNPTNAARLEAALNSKKRVSFASEEELRRAIGL
ncbi:MAG: hypothetical protein WCN98_09640 [Verrucomicrobiaceae bacterium]